MFPLPSHLTTSRVQSRNIRFWWDDWNTELVEEAPDDWLVGNIALISDRAALALVTAMGEWIVHRFEPLSTDPLPKQLIEAAWAAGANWRYQAETWEAVTRDQLWGGPIRGPLGAAMSAVDYDIELARMGGDLSVGARWVSNIAQHVLPVTDAFRQWRTAVLDRLLALFPRNPSDPIGDPVPRETFDVFRQFNYDEIEALINQLLGTLDAKNHRFLASAQQLAEGGFTGAPYRFDLRRDRFERRFW